MSRRVALDLAWRMLTRERKRFYASIAGIAFSTLGVFMALGFFNGMNDSQARIATVLNADFVLISRHTQTVNNLGDFGRRDFLRARAVEHVMEVIPIQHGALEIKNPDTGMKRSIQCYAFPPDADPFLIPGLEENRRMLRRLGTILYDECSRDIFGDIHEGMSVEVIGVRLDVGGTVRYGPNFSRHGTIFMSLATYHDRLRQGGVESISLGAIRVSRGAPMATVRRQLEGLFDDEYELITPNELRFRELVYNTRSTPVGALLAIALLVAFFVGTIVSYQVLYTEVADHLGQFATLKAMGFHETFLNQIVHMEGLLLSALGFLPGVALTTILYAFVELASQTHMELTWMRVGSAYLLTGSMCLVAARMALNQVHTADPADLF